MYGILTICTAISEPDPGGPGPLGAVPAMTDMAASSMAEDESQMWRRKCDLLECALESLKDERDRLEAERDDLKQQCEQRELMVFTELL